jgi:hypothetical protein
MPRAREEIRKTHLVAQYAPDLLRDTPSYGRRGDATRLRTRDHTSVLRPARLHEILRKL